MPAAPGDPATAASTSEQDPSTSTSASATTSTSTSTHTDDKPRIGVGAKKWISATADLDDIEDPPSSYPAHLYEAVNFPKLQNRLLLDAAASFPGLPRSPVWCMRQAGRYLPEFRALRKKHGFFEICRTPELAAEITLQPTRRYKGLLDAAIIFSDILVIPQAMGMEVQMLPEVGPHFPNPIKSVSEAIALAEKTYDVKASLDYMYRALTLTRHLLEGQVPLIGFCGAPWTLFAYMVEGGGSKTFSKAKEFLFAHPDESRALLTKIGEVGAEFLVEQIKAGAQLVQIFDSWAGELGQKDFNEYELPVLKHMLAIIKKAEPNTSVIVFAKGANHAIPDLANAGFDTIGLDWNISPAEARRLIGDQPVGLQGNLDPATLLESDETIDSAVKEMFLGEYGFLNSDNGRKYGHIANLGHGITPNVHPDSLKCFFEAVHKYSRRTSESNA